MCGLVFSNRSDLTASQFLAATTSLKHRGPDHQAVWRDSRAQLGHTRLSILDLDQRSNQPMISHSGKFVMIFNGEIYNFQSLANQFGIKLKRNSDSELLLELFEKLGNRALPHLIGMFAFVIYDTTNGAIFAARDRLGVKPLYMHVDAGGVSFASEISALRHVVTLNKIDELAWDQYRTLRMFTGGKTIFSNVSQFPAGSFWENGVFTKYWQLEQQFDTPPSDDELVSLLTDAVELRTISDVPVGAYLSGGVDSSVIAAMAKVENTWTVGTARNNEFNEASETARHISSHHHNIEVSDSLFLNTAARMIADRQEPLCVPNEVLLKVLNESVAPTNRVMLTGEGADELFGGYSRIFDWAASATSFDLKKFAELYCYGLNPDLEVVEEALAPSPGDSAYQVVSRFFQLNHLEGLLRRVDNATMAVGIEARVPFVDHRLVERLFCVPYSWKNSGGISKAPLRRLSRNLLPKSASMRPKLGFPVNMEGIFAGFLSANPGTSTYDAWFDFNRRTLESVLNGGK